jgi:hypothetical protein
MGTNWFFRRRYLFLPATSYYATLKYSKYDRFGNAKDIQFHTAALKLQNSNRVLQDENSKTYVPQLELFFNYPVDPSLLKEKMKLTLGSAVAMYNGEYHSYNGAGTIRVVE